jgi:hypothetical protein
VRKAVMATCAVLALAGCTQYDLDNLGAVIGTLTDVALVGAGVAALSQPAQPTRTFCQRYGVNPDGVASYTCW